MRSLKSSFACMLLSALLTACTAGLSPRESATDYQLYVLAVYDDSAAMQAPGRSSRCRPRLSWRRSGKWRRRRN